MSDWIVNQTTAPSVNRDVVKQHCRIPVDLTDDDALIDDYIAAALVQVSRDSERILGKATAVWYGQLSYGLDYPDFLTLGPITALPLLPENPGATDPLLAGIVSVQYRDTDGDYITINSANYQWLNPGQEPPVLGVRTGYDDGIDANSPTPWKITLNVGYSTLPGPLLQGVKLWVAEYYRNREVLTYGQTSADFKRAYDSAMRSVQWRFKG